MKSLGSDIGDPRLAGSGLLPITLAEYGLVRLEEAAVVKGLTAVAGTCQIFGRAAVQILPGFVRMRHVLSGAVLAAALMISFAASQPASALTYTVNRTVGTSTVTGTIDTDGSFGTLATANITAWNVTLQDGAASFTLSNSIAGQQHGIDGSGVTADASHIYFDFSLGSYLLFQSTTLFSGTGSSFWCFHLTACGSTSPNTEQTAINYPTAFQAVAESGKVIVASRDASSDVPVPAALPLLASGLGALGWLGGRQRRKAG